MTTSWGVSTKITVGESSTFNDGLENATESVKDTTKAGHDGTVKVADLGLAVVVGDRLRREMGMASEGRKGAGTADRNLGNGKERA